MVSCELLTVACNNFYLTHIAVVSPNQKTDI